LRVESLEFGVAPLMSSLRRALGEMGSMSGKEVGVGNAECGMNLESLNLESLNLESLNLEIINN
jgi:hypothetical protein